MTDYENLKAMLNRVEREGQSNTNYTLIGWDGGTELHLGADYEVVVFRFGLKGELVATWVIS